MPAAAPAAPEMTAQAMPASVTPKLATLPTPTGRYCPPLEMPPAGSVCYAPEAAPATPTTPSSTHTVHNPYSAFTEDPDTADPDFVDVPTAPTSAATTPTGVPPPLLQPPQYVPYMGHPASPLSPPVVMPGGAFGMRYPAGPPAPNGVPMVYPHSPVYPIHPGYGYPAQQQNGYMPHPGYHRMMGQPLEMTLGTMGYAPSSPVTASPHSHPGAAMFPHHPVSQPSTPAMSATYTPVPSFDSVPSDPTAAAADEEARNKKRRRKRGGKGEQKEDNKAVDAVRYKTKLCKNWIMSNKCPYGPRCLFAHGSRELRSCEMNSDAIVVASATKSPERQFYAVGRFPTFVPLPRDLLGEYDGEEMDATLVIQPQVAPLTTELRVPPAVATTAEQSMEASRVQA